MTVTQVETAAVRYAREVRAALADLPESEVTELGEDLDGHLAEVEAELGADAAHDAFVARLGPPAAYAAELRQAAGLPPRLPYGSPPPTGGIRASWRAISAWWLLVTAVLSVPTFGYTVLDTLGSGLAEIGLAPVAVIALIMFGWIPGVAVLWIAANRFPRLRDFADGLAFRGPRRPDGAPVELTWALRLCVALTVVLGVPVWWGWSQVGYLIPALWLGAAVLFGAAYHLAPWREEYTAAVKSLPDVVALRGLVTRMRTTDTGDAFVGFAASLRPAWWLARAFAATLLLADAAAPVHGYLAVPFFLVAAVVSVWLGRRNKTAAGWNVLSVPGNLLAAYLLVDLLVRAPW